MNVTARSPRTGSVRGVLMSDAAWVLYGLRVYAIFCTEYGCMVDGTQRTRGFGVYVALNAWLNGIYT